MNYNETNLVDYKSPHASVHEIQTEGIFCYSPGGDNEDYGGVPGSDSF